MCKMHHITLRAEVVAFVLVIQKLACWQVCAVL